MHPARRASTQRSSFRAPERLNASPRREIPWATRTSPFVSSRRFAGGSSRSAPSPRRSTCRSCSAVLSGGLREALHLSARLEPRWRGTGGRMRAAHAVPPRRRVDPSCRGVQRAWTRPSATTVNAPGRSAAGARKFEVACARGARSRRAIILTSQSINSRHFSKLCHRSFDVGHSFETGGKEPLVRSSSDGGPLV
jgi:hypothetical protein